MTIGFSGQSIVKHADLKGIVDEFLDDVIDLHRLMVLLELLMRFDLTEHQPHLTYVGLRRNGIVEVNQRDIFFYLGETLSWIDVNAFWIRAGWKLFIGLSLCFAMEAAECYSWFDDVKNQSDLALMQSHTIPVQ